MKLNLFLLLTAIVLLAIATVFEVNYLDYASPIPYEKINTISFSDFKAYAKPDLTLDGMKEFAYICPSRKMVYTSDSSVDITTYFHPSRSYVFNQHIRDQDLLTHELYHFKIAEYYSRTIRSEISNFQGRLSAAHLDDIFEKYNLTEQLMQRTYDDESYHSYVLAQQKKWEHNIDSLLLSLEKFSSPTVTFHQ
jgi:hypothetical protein